MIQHAIVNSTDSIFHEIIMKPDGQTEQLTEKDILN